MKVDDIFTDHIGELGSFQRIVLFILAMGEFFMPMATLGPVFFAAVPEYWCASTEPMTNDSTMSYNESMVGVNDTAASNDQCWSGDYSLTNTSSNVRCQKWRYSKELYDNTIVSEWDLVCDKTWLVGTISAVYMAGRTTGNIVFGYLADRFGNRRVLLAAGFVQILCSCACAAAPNITLLLIARFLVANFLSGKGNCGYVLVNEFSGPNMRVFCGNVYFTFWCIGYTAFAGIAYLVREWRVLILVTALPELLVYIAFFYFVPESPRWLIAKNRKDDAMRVLHRMASFNKVTLPKDIEVLEDTKTTEYTENNTSLVDLVRTPQLRFLTFCLSFIWFSSYFVYYGLALNSSSLGGNPYINFAIAGAVELPAYLSVPVVCSYIGRIPSIIGCFVFAGLMLIASIPVPANMVWAIITLSMLGKFFTTSVTSLDWSYSCEVFPTTIRNQGVNVTSSAARFASIIASYVGLLSEVAKALPFVIYGTISMAAALLTLMLPETKNMHLQQTIPEAEKFIKTKRVYRRKKKARQDAQIIV